MQRLLVLEDELGNPQGGVPGLVLGPASRSDGRNGLEMARSGHHEPGAARPRAVRPGRGGQRGLTVKVGRRTRGTFTPTVKATSGSIAYQATTKLTVK